MYAWVGATRFAVVVRPYPEYKEQQTEKPAPDEEQLNEERHRQLSKKTNNKWSSQNQSMQRKPSQSKRPLFQDQPGNIKKQKG